MRADFVNPFLHAVLNVLRTMANMQPQLGRAALKQDDVARGVVTGFIDLMGEQTAGSLAISFSKPVALDLVSRMLGERLTDIDDTVEDLIGEITNMVTGGAKRLLAERGYNFYLSQPVILSGANGYRIQHSNRGPTILLPFQAEAGQFFVEICFREDTPQKLPDDMAPVEEPKDPV